VKEKFQRQEYSRQTTHATLTVAPVDGATYQRVRYPFTHPGLQPAESAVGTSQTLLQRVLPCFRRRRESAVRSKLQGAMLQKQVVEAAKQSCSFVSFSCRHFSHLAGTASDFESVIAACSVVLLLPRLSSYLPSCSHR
jgi:hypothetical protein